MKSVRPEDTDRLVDYVIKVELAGTRHSEQRWKRENLDAQLLQKRIVRREISLKVCVLCRVENGMDQRRFEQDKLSLRAVCHLDQSFQK
jgi:hypothetical protein